MFKGSDQWRGRLYIELEAWYKDFQPSKRRRSTLRAVSEEHVDNVPVFRDMDDFVDPLAVGGAPAAAAAAAPAAAAAAAGGE